MDFVPTEILLQVFEYLDSPAPSETHLHDEPGLELLTTQPGGPRPPLKAVSLVSRSWRSLSLPRLFRHVLWKPNVYSLSAFTLNPIPLLRFLSENDLAHRVITFTLVIDFHDPAAVDHQVAPRIRTADLEWLWDQIFSVIDPLRFTIFSRPTTLAALLSCMLYLNDAWFFDIPYHILSFSRSSRQVKTGSDGPPSGTSTDTRSSMPAISSTSRCLATDSRQVACPLFTIRPWTSLLLNEGSSTKVYRVYEFYLRRPPSILGALLGCEEYPNNVPLIPPSVVDFNYIAIFPLASHFQMLLEHLPRINRLFVQLQARPESGILENGDEMRHIDPNDLWLERDTSYTVLMRELILSDNPRANWRLLRNFESGDFIDSEAWELITQIFERSETKEWTVERPGVFTRLIDDKAVGRSDQEIGHVGAFTNTPNSNVM
ncbi:hypothetical protein F5B22DRAFT_594836 [Xylaria bambusicola]|uniref:uncharacterized protein n=1 Tax=Xylaria bambusicola TaxID=326684 RepID=UPI0020077039|nr:uncharacterized protein F5B22DRAFT_594836 [Xylaria bambusicola]KAI0521953.1 hypothetical protein F5B22DRAFT_594836 [Xylaria bambusicola]